MRRLLSNARKVKEKFCKNKEVLNYVRSVHLGISNINEKCARGRDMSDAEDLRQKSREKNCHLVGCRFYFILVQFSMAHT